MPAALELGFALARVLRLATQIALVPARLFRTTYFPQALLLQPSLYSGDSLLGVPSCSHQQLCCRLMRLYLGWPVILAVVRGHPVLYFWRWWLPAS